MAINALEHLDTWEGFSLYWKSYISLPNKIEKQYSPIEHSSSKIKVPSVFMLSLCMCACMDVPTLQPTPFELAS